MLSSCQVLSQSGTIRDSHTGEDGIAVCGARVSASPGQRQPASLIGLAKAVGLAYPTASISRPYKALHLFPPFLCHLHAQQCFARLSGLLDALSGPLTLRTLLAVHLAGKSISLNFLSSFILSPPTTCNLPLSLHSPKLLSTHNSPPALFAVQQP